MFKHKKSIAAVLSALAITATGASTVSSAAFSKSTNVNNIYETVDDNKSETNGMFRSAISQKRTGAVRYIPERLACLIAGIRTNSVTYEPIITTELDYRLFQKAMEKIKGYHATIYCPTKYRYAQNTGTYFNGCNYGCNDKSMCSAYAIATARSIYDGKQMLPNEVKHNSDGVLWSEVTEVDVGRNSDLTEDEILLAIDAQLEMGKPALIQAKRNSDGKVHWATVIGKSGSEGSAGDNYTIIDPWNGSQCSLGEMMYYKDGGTFVGYAILDEEVFVK